MTKIGNPVRIVSGGESYYGNPPDWTGREGVVEAVDYDSVKVSFSSDDWGWYRHNEYQHLRDGKFWMVLRDGSTYTNVRHDTYQSASQEARRLAQQQPGAEFYVLELVLITIGKVVVEDTDV